MLHILLISADVNRILISGLIYIYICFDKEITLWTLYWFLLCNFNLLRIGLGHGGDPIAYDQMCST